MLDKCPQILYNSISSSNNGCQIMADTTSSKTFKIWFYHGQDRNLEAELLEAGCAVSDKQFTYTGSLDAFAHNYHRQFIVRPGTGEQFICVTQHGSFGMR